MALTRDTMTGGDTFACEGTSQGEHRDGAWHAGCPTCPSGARAAPPAGEAGAAGHDPSRRQPPASQGPGRARLTAGRDPGDPGGGSGARRRHPTA